MLLCLLALSGVPVLFIIESKLYHKHTAMLWQAPVNSGASDSTAVAAAGANAAPNASQKQLSADFG